MTKPLFRHWIKIWTFLPDNNGKMLTNKILDSDWLKSHEIHEADPIFHTGCLYHKCINICACTKINLLSDVKCLQMSSNINLLATQVLYRFIILVTENQPAVLQSFSEFDVRFQTSEFLGTFKDIIV